MPIREVGSSEAFATGSTKCFSRHAPGIRRDSAVTTIDHGADRALRLPPIRDEFELMSVIEPVADVECLLPLRIRVLESTVVRRLIVVGILALVWEGYATNLDNPLMMPRLSEVVVALVSSLASGGLAVRILMTMKVLLIGYSAGILAAATITILASTTRFGSDVLSTLTSMFNPLPAVALLPLALLWFGLGIGSLVFVIINSVLWAVALNTHTGFQSVSETLRMAGRCFGLSKLSLVAEILIPAALPSILAGLKIGWAFAWRTLIAAELVFGVSSGQGGLGWFIYENRNNLETANVFAGLLCVILIGLFVESVIFRTIERRTVRRWGMQKF
jgi:NitT/TauT family transport system permease protein